MTEKQRLLLAIEEELKDMTEEEKQEVLTCLLDKKKGAAWWLRPFAFFGLIKGQAELNGYFT